MQDLCIVIRKSAMSLVFYIHNYVHNSHPKLIRANKVLTCSKNCQYKLKFTILDLTSLKLADFHDASFGNLSHGWSQGGFIIFFVDRKGNDPLSWASKRIKRIVKPMLVTEILPLAENTFLLANFIEELMPHKKNQCYMFKDSKSPGYGMMHRWQPMPALSPVQIKKKHT